MAQKYHRSGGKYPACNLRAGWHDDRGQQDREGCAPGNISGCHVLCLFSPAPELCGLPPTELCRIRCTPLPFCSTLRPACAVHNRAARESQPRSVRSATRFRSPDAPFPAHQSGYATRFCTGDAASLRAMLLCAVSSHQPPQQGKHERHPGPPKAGCDDGTARPAFRPVRAFRLPQCDTCVCGSVDHRITPCIRCARPAPAGGHPVRACDHHHRTPSRAIVRLRL